jgi:low temperature requirement protein LtrA
MNDNSHLLRQRSGDGHARVTFIELFFDLVFVFAITQLSHLLLHSLTPSGALQTLLLVFAVWWVWIFTSWVTNWLDPEETAVRIMLFALMLGGLVLASAIPKAFEERGLWFALAYVAMQVGRSCFMLWAVRGEPVNFRNFQRITCWLALTGVFWLAGGIASGEVRVWLWLLAMLVEFISPSVGFWVPGLGRSSTEDWDVAGGHIAERCGLFVIIALGESILMTGATFAALDSWTALDLAGFFIGFIGSIAMWWIYFNIGAERASRIISSTSDPGRIARLAYTYTHIVLIAGIIVSAVSDEIILKHPTGHTDMTAVLVLTGGPALFIAGCLLFKWATAGWPPLSHMAGLGVLAALFFIGPALSPLLLGIAANGVLVLVAAWETISLPAEAREPELDAE